MELGQESPAVVRISRTFAAPPRRVFDAFTTARDLAAWAWGSLAQRAEAEVDLRVGGTYRVATARPGGETWAFTGTYVQVQPPRRLAYTLRWEAPMGYDAPQETVTVDIDPDGAGSRISFTHEGVPTPGARAGHRRGWSDAFDALVRLLLAAQS